MSPYPMAAVRAKGGRKAAPAVPWYLAGGIAPSKPIIVYQPKGAANLAASLINIVNPGTYDASAPTSAPTHDPTYGWLFDGLANYLITSFIPAINTSEYTMIIRYSDLHDHAADQRVYCGYEKQIGARRWFLTTGAILAFETPPVSGGTAIDAAVLAARQLRYLYRDGVLIATNSNTNAFLLNTAIIRIGSCQIDGDEATAKKFIDCKVQAFALYGANSGITEAQIQAVTTAMAAL